MKPRLAAVLLATVLLSLAPSCSPVPSWNPPEPPPVDKSVERSLWEAAQGCDPRSLAALVRAGAKLDAPKGPDETTPLMEAVRSFGPGCPQQNVVVLLTNGAKVNQLDKNGRSALHHLVTTECTEPYIDVLNLLLKWNADPAIKDKKEKTPLALAAERGCNHMVKILADAIAQRQAQPAKPEASAPAVRTDQEPSARP